MTDTTTATFGALELRVPDMSERIVEGIVVPWDETSFLTPDPNGERFRPGSLNRTLGDRDRQRRPVLLFRNHNHEKAVGKSLSWENRDNGCWMQFRIGSGLDGDAILTEVTEGLLDAFSVGFIPVRHARGDDGAREVVEAKLHEVSITPIGAYDGARVLAVRKPAEPVSTIPPLPPMPKVDLSPVVLPSRWTH
jgi:hypothetical protein